MRTGVRLGIDAGKVRVGIAVSDPTGTLATPVTTLMRESESLLSDVAQIVSENSVFEIIVGLPLNLSGGHTPSTENAIELARDVEAFTGISVRLVDERLTTVSAHSALRATGKKQRGTRSVIDQVAAVMVLQHALETERSSDKPPGTPLGDI